MADALPATISLSEVLANSYRDFHAKGLDYLCLKRSEAETIKVYFFADAATQLPEVVAPHDHRYPFSTTVLAGALINHRYARTGPDNRFGQPYERFSYLTPLNGGDGFTWEATDRLEMTHFDVYLPGDTHAHQPADLHTISPLEGAVLLLKQGADEVPVNRPTHCWRPAGRRTPPDLDGLYSPMKADDAMTLLETAYRLAGQRLLEVIE